jgi:hypothetical protein
MCFLLRYPWKISLYVDKQKQKGLGNVAQELKYVPTKLKALSLNSYTATPPQKKPKTKTTTTKNQEGN